MKPINALTISVSAFALLAFCVPSTTFASNTPTVLKSANTTAELSAELSNISSELLAGVNGTTSFTLAPGGTIIQATSTGSNGILKITLPAFEHTNPDKSAKVQQPVQYLAKITLQYLPCEAASPTTCTATASTSYPVMTSDLASGQDTGYLHYLITLTNLSSTTATFQVTDTNFISNLQDQVNEIAAKVAATLSN